MSNYSWDEFWALPTAPKAVDAEFMQWLNSQSPETRKEILAAAPPEIVRLCTPPPPVVPQTSAPPKEWYQVGYAPPIVPHKSAPIVPKRTPAKAHKKRKSYLWLILLAYALLIALCVLPGLIYRIH
jgi:hypothetical protein